jgi:hypothetical protein
MSSPPLGFNLLYAFPAAASCATFMDEHPRSEADPTPRLCGDDGADLILSALDHLRNVLQGSGEAHWKADAFRQKGPLREWAEDLDLLLNPESLLPLLKVGGQEHDICFDALRDRCVKLTRDGVFGLTPGIELALVPSDQDARRFHLWEASPYQYLERLRLQNLITPGLNRLEGIVAQEEDFAICISQPRLELIAVSQTEIDEWFASLGFEVVTSAAYYRRDDNLGVFDAHEKNVVRSSSDSEVLIPFDVIPVQPDDGFLEFIHATLDAGSELRVVRKTQTATRSASD